MLRKLVLNVVVPTIIALLVTGTDAEAGEKVRCGKTQAACNESCKCPLATDIEGGAKWSSEVIASDRCKCGPDCNCPAAEVCACGTDCRCGRRDEVVATDKVELRSGCERFSSGKFKCRSKRKGGVEQIAALGQCKCGSACRCAATANGHVLRLHRQLVRMLETNAHLIARSQARDEFDEFKDTFIERLIGAETEIANLNAQLQVAAQRQQMTQEMVSAVSENAKLKAQIELAHERQKLIQNYVATQHGGFSGKLAAALTEAKADNAKLTQRVAELESQLETLKLRLASKPSNKQVK